jgi:hypothetical protein
MRTELWFALMLALVAAARWLDCAKSEPADFENDTAKDPVNGKHR